MLLPDWLETSWPEGQDVSHRHPEISAALQLLPKDGFALWVYRAGREQEDPLLQRPGAQSSQSVDCSLSTCSVPNLVLTKESSGNDSGGCGCVAFGLRSQYKQYRTRQKGLSAMRLRGHIVRPHPLLQAITELFYL